MDQISYITIAGYKLFKDQRRIDFSKPGHDSLGLNIIVGTNNVGKSSLINLLGSGYYQQINREDWSADNPSVEVSSGEKSIRVQYARNRINPQVIMTPEGQPPNLQSMFLPTDRRWSFESTNVMLTPMNGDPAELSSYMQNSNSVVMQLSGSYSANQNYEPIKKPIEQFIGTLLFIHQSDELKRKYTELVKEFIPNYQGFELLRKRGNKHQVLYRSEDANGYIDMSLVGDGIQTIMVICAFLLFARTSGTAPYLPQQPASMLVMDEPENSLHPQAQIKLFNYLKELSRSMQVIYATHSPYFVNWEIVAQGGRIIRLDSTDSLQAEVNVLTKEVVEFSVSPRRVSNLDIISREIVFTNKALIVEGLDDANILRSFIETEGLKYSFQICGHGADGSGNIAKWLKAASALGIASAAIYDSNASSEASVAANVVGANKVFQWSQSDIRDKGDIQGLFTEEGTIKAEHKQEVVQILDQVEAALST